MYPIQASKVAISIQFSPIFTFSLSSSSPVRRRVLIKTNHNLKPLTSRIVQLTRRRQLRQIFEEIEIAKRRYGRLNTIVMNAVMEACVHCGDIDAALRIFREMSKPDSCGVDNITYGTLLKGLGDARRIDEAFQLLELVEEGSAVGNPKLSSPLICGLLNALIVAGDLRRANGLLARYGVLLQEGSSSSVLIYNLLMKGYINSGSPEAALTVYEELLRQGLEPDRLTFNTLIFACVKVGNLDRAVEFFEEMKQKARDIDQELFPDAVTYTILLKGFGDSKDLLSVERVVLEMKSHDNLLMDRTAYTATVDALLNCGLIMVALCAFGEVVKRAGQIPDLRPKPHLYLSMMRAFAVRGDYSMVSSLHRRMWPDTAGSITPKSHEEADHFLMEAALNDGQVDVAIQHLSDIIKRWKGICWTTRGGMVAVRIEAMLGITRSMFSPSFLSQQVCIYLTWLEEVSPKQAGEYLSKVPLSEPICNIMTPFAAAKPLLASLQLKEVTMRFFKDSVVPVVDDWGNCIGLLHREDCNEINDPLVAMMRSPPPCVTATTSIRRVLDLILEKRHKMVVVVKHNDSYGSSGYTTSVRAVGVFTADQLLKLIRPLPFPFSGCLDEEPL